MKLGKSTSKVFTEGVLQKEGAQKTLKNWLDSKAGKLEKDTLAAEIFPDNGEWRKINKYQRGTQAASKILFKSIF